MDESAASPEGGGGLQRVFYCHQCLRRTFPNAEHVQNFTCPNCDSSFVEDVTIREDSPSTQSDDQSWGGLEAAIADSVESIAEGLAENWDNDSSASSTSSQPRRQGRRPRARIHMSQPGGQIADQFINTLLANLIGGPRGPGIGLEIPGAIHISGGNGTGRGGGGGAAAMAGFPGIFQMASGGGAVPMVPLYGNPGDYAWGRGGLDAIVTQLLNQMDGTGPPPMTGDEIKNIPTIKVTQTHIDEKCQCSVCWDDFKLGEEVRQLKCEHIFHEDCIIPWLELHNTCPVCRKEQAEVDQENQPQVSGETASNSASNSQNLAASNSRASNQGSNSELMEALGHSMSVFNSLFGLPPEQQHQQGSQQPAPSTATSTQREPSPPTQATSRSSTSTSTATRDTSNTNDERFHDMDLE